MAAHKCLEMISGMILNRLQTKFTVNLVANENAMFESYVVTSMDMTSFDFRFAQKVSLFKFLRLMSCSMSIKQKLC